MKTGARDSFLEPSQCPRSSRTAEPRFRQLGTAFIAPAMPGVPPRRRSISRFSLSSAVRLLPYRSAATPSMRANRISGIRIAAIELSLRGPRQGRMDREPCRLDSLGVNGSRSRGAKLAQDFSGGAHTRTHELEEILRQYGFSLHSGDLGDPGDLACTVGKPSDLNNDVERRGDVLTHRPLRQDNPREQHHHFEPAQRIARIIGMYRRHRTVMAGGHRLQHV